MRNLTGKKAVVTGAASGIGKAIAQELARAGANLFLIDQDEVNLLKSVRQCQDLGAETAYEITNLACADNVAATAASILARHAPIDLLINNAGVSCYGASETMPLEEWERLLSVNLLCPVRLTMALMPHLLSRPEANITNVTSIYGLFVTRRCTAYHTTKFGILGFSEALRAEYCRSQLSVTTLCPGYVRTNLYGKLIQSGDWRDIQPPRWASTTAEHVARKTVAAIRRKQRLCLVTPVAYGAYYGVRLVPGLIDWINVLQRRSVRKPKQIESKDEVRRAA